jgi:hypothetical protein
MVSLTRRPQAAPVEPAAPAVPVEPTAAPPQSDSPMGDVLERAADSIPFPPGGPDPSAIQQQIQAQQLAEQKQREILAAMKIEQERPKEPPQFSERDLAFLGARPGIERDPAFHRGVQGISAAAPYGSDRFYALLEAAYPLEDYRRVEPKHNSDAAPPAIEREEPKPARRVVVSAPVSRDVPSGNYESPRGRIVLSPTEREIAHGARHPGQSLEEAEILYARNKALLEQRKREGHYSNEK